MTDAERPDGDPLKSNYRAKRVYWYEVPGRFVTYYKLNEFRLKENGITKEEIFEQVKSEYSEITNVIVEPYKGKMLQFKTVRMDLLVTPNHRVILNRFIYLKFIRLVKIHPAC